MDLLQPHSGQEAATIDISKEAAACANWPTRERLRALKRIIPRADIEGVLQRTGTNRAHCRRLPAWFLVWFVIALGLFCRDCYRQVFRWLQPYRKGGTPRRTTLCEARKRLGVAPMRLLTEQVIRLQGTPTTPGAFYRGMRTMALDGFVVDVPETPANERAFGRPGSSRAPAAFPQARVLSLCETGSHVLWRSLIKPCSRGEVTMAHHLLRSLQKDMLLLWDRNFLSYQTVAAVRRRGAHLLARIKSNLIFEPIRVLDDGSYLAKLYRSPADRRKDRDGIPVRIIEYTFDDPGRDGSGEAHRLLTTLLDDALDPAETLIVLYHERWEEELTIDEFKTHQRERPVLRSQTPGGVVQELYGLLLGHYVIRVLMQEAAAVNGIDPQRLSFTGTLKILRCRLPECPASRRGLRQWYRNLVAEVAEEVLEKRRDRVNPRVIKRKMSNWRKKRPEHRNYPQPHKEFRDAIVMRR
ncbi:MAG TPA: IS4 family transposase [Isosphaeraceae bacterium]|nr:IS4 family transposase [Isosphaeraceae bacterium]